MELVCRCHGFSGSCSLRTCWRELPTVHDISDALKEKHDEAVKVEVTIPRDGSPAFLQYLDPVTNRHVYPPNANLVYVEQSEDFCSTNGNFTRDRQCLPEELLPGSGSTGSSGMLGGIGYTNTDLREIAMAEHFPPCESFCCTGQYVEIVKTISQTCNCRFIWCCDVVCDTCTQNITEYRCTGWQEKYVPVINYVMSCDHISHFCTVMWMIASIISLTWCTCLLTGFFFTIVSAC